MAFISSTKHHASAARRRRRRRPVNQINGPRINTSRPCASLNFFNTLSFSLRLSIYVSFFLEVHKLQTVLGRRKKNNTPRFTRRRTWVYRGGGGVVDVYFFPPKSRVIYWAPTYTRIVYIRVHILL